MGAMMEFAALLLILGALALILGPRLMGKRGPRGEMASGTLLVTGVSPRPDVPGEQFVTISAGTTTNPCPADFDNDNSVGASDLAIMLSGWGGTGATDLDGDGSTGASDLSILLSSWGACP